MRTMLFTVIFLTLVFVSGCVSDKEARANSRLPWSAPAAWEGQTLGVPF